MIILKVTSWTRQQSDGAARCSQDIMLSWRHLRERYGACMVEIMQTPSFPAAWCTPWYIISNTFAAATRLHMPHLPLQYGRPLTLSLMLRLPLQCGCPLTLSLVLHLPLQCGCLLTLSLFIALPYVLWLRAAAVDVRPSVSRQLRRRETGVPHAGYICGPSN